MSTVKVHFDGLVFIPDEPVHLNPGAKGEVHVEPEQPVRRVPQAGWLQGKIRMSEDFDEPLEDFKDYM